MNHSDDTATGDIRETLAAWELDKAGYTEAQIMAFELVIAHLLNSDKQQVLDELLQYANTYSNDGDFNDDAPSLIEAIPVSAVHQVIAEIKEQ